MRKSEPLHDENGRRLCQLFSHEMRVKHALTDHWRARNRLSASTAVPYPSRRRSNKHAVLTRHDKSGRLRTPPFHTPPSPFPLTAPPAPAAHKSPRHTPSKYASPTPSKRTTAEWRSHIESPPPAAAL